MNFRINISNPKNREKMCFLKNEQDHTSHRIITEGFKSVSLESRGREEIGMGNIEKNDPEFPKFGGRYKLADSRSSVNPQQ